MSDSEYAKEAARRVLQERKAREAKLAKFQAEEEEKRRRAREDRAREGTEKERRRLEVYAFNQLMCASEIAAVEEYIKGLMREGNGPVTTEAAVDFTGGVDSDGSDVEDAGAGGSGGGGGSGSESNGDVGKPAAAAGAESSENVATLGSLPQHLRV